MKYLSLSACLLYTCLAGGVVAATAAAVDYPEAILAQAAEQEDWFVSGEDAYGYGVVLLGQLVLADGGDPLLSAFRDNLAPGGYFATFLYPGREMTFWQHGYAPVVLPYPSGKRGIVDVGQVTMLPSDPQAAGSVTGKIFLNDPAAGPATVELWVRMTPTHLDDDGHLGGCRVSYRVKSVEVPHEAAFTFSGLSPIGYELKYSAPGHVREVQRFDHAPAASVTVDPVTLATSTALEFTTISPLEDFGAGDLSRQVRRSVEANGSQRLIFTDLRDDLGNTHNFRFRLRGGAIIISYWMHPWYFIDLGALPLAEAIEVAAQFRDADEGVLSRAGTIYTPLKSGHSYYFVCPENGIDCLFQVSF